MQEISTKFEMQYENDPLFVIAHFSHSHTSLRTWFESFRHESQSCREQFANYFVGFRNTSKELSKEKEKNEKESSPSGVKCFNDKSKNKSGNSDNWKPPNL